VQLLWAFYLAEHIRARVRMSPLTGRSPNQEQGVRRPRTRVMAVEDVEHPQTALLSLIDYSIVGQFAFVSAPSNRSAMRLFAVDLALLYESTSDCY
jgi:hypothetical protein